MEISLPRIAVRLLEALRRDQEPGEPVDSYAGSVLAPEPSVPSAPVEPGDPAYARVRALAPSADYAVRAWELLQDPNTRSLRPDQVMYRVLKWSRQDAVDLIPLAFHVAQEGASEPFHWLGYQRTADNIRYQLQDEALPHLLKTYHAFRDGQTLARLADEWGALVTHPAARAALFSNLIDYPQTEDTFAGRQKLLQRVAADMASEEVPPTEGFRVADRMVSELAGLEPTLENARNAAALARVFATLGHSFKPCLEFLERSPLKDVPPMVRDWCGAAEENDGPAIFDLIMSHLDDRVAVLEGLAGAEGISRWSKHQIMALELERSATDPAQAPVALWLGRCLLASSNSRLDEVMENLRRNPGLAGLTASVDAWSEGMEMWGRSRVAKCLLARPEALNTTEGRLGLFKQVLGDLDRGPDQAALGKVAGAELVGMGLAGEELLVRAQDVLLEHSARTGGPLVLDAVMAGIDDPGLRASLAELKPLFDGDGAAGVLARAQREIKLYAQHRSEVEAVLSQPRTGLGVAEHEGAIIVGGTRVKKR